MSRASSKTPSRFPAGVAIGPKELPTGNFNIADPMRWSYWAEDFVIAPYYSDGTTSSSTTTLEVTTVGGWGVGATCTAGTAVVTAGGGNTQVANYGGSIVTLATGTTAADYTALRGTATGTAAVSSQTLFQQKKFVWGTSFAIGHASIIGQIGFIAAADIAGTATSGINGTYLHATSSVASVYLSDGTTQLTLPGTITLATSTWYDVQVYWDGKGTAGSLSGAYRTRTATSATVFATSGWTSLGSTGNSAIALTGTTGAVGPSLYAEQVGGVTSRILAVDHLFLATER